MKRFRKAASLFMAVLMLLSCLGTFALAARENYNHLPQVYVEGLIPNKGEAVK